MDQTEDKISVCPENVEPKRKRERKRSQKRCEANASTLVQIGTAKMSETLVTKIKHNRRRIRSKKQDHAATTELDNSVSMELSSLSIQPQFSNQSSCSSNIIELAQMSHKEQKVKRKVFSSRKSKENGCSREENVYSCPETNNTEKNRENFPNVKTSNNEKKKTNHNKSNSEKNCKFDDPMPLEEVSSGLQSGELFCGVMRINPKDFKLSYITNPNKQEQDILIESLRERNGALEGDEVVVKLKNETEWRSATQKTGFVVYLMRKVHPRTAVGILKLMADKNKLFALLHPRDTRIPRIKIPFTNWPLLFYEQADQYEKVLFLGKILNWSDPRYAVGTILENIGMSGDIKSETKAILTENCLDVTPFEDEMRKYFPETGAIPSEEYARRVDMRRECVFTIDPLTARDLDDAVSCKHLANGNVEVGVHISDVSYYLAEDSPLDAAVAAKGTSVYMVESVYHMLPRELCMMCSLLPAEDKLTMSVFWELTPEGKVVSHRFARTVIHSCVQLAYEHAQLMIDDPNRQFGPNELPTIHNGFSAEDISRAVNSLHRIALNLRESRFQSGALRIDQPKVMFRLEAATGLPVSYELYVNKECHRMIEEFMLLANITVATRLRSDYPDVAFLRSHPAPHDYMMNTLKSTLERVGIHLDVSSAGGLQQTLWKYSGNDYLSQARMLVLSTLCAKPMTRAHYFCSANSADPEEHWHYALSVPLYTHFTSPIRRYADIMVHRQLVGSLGYAARPVWSADRVAEVAANCNKQKYNAKRAGEQSIELYLLHYIGMHQPLIEKAVVMDVKDKSFDAIVIANGLTIRIYLNNLEENVKHRVVNDESTSENGKNLMNLILQWPENDGKAAAKQIISIFSIITVSLTKKDKVLKVEAKIVRPDEL